MRFRHISDIHIRNVTRHKQYREVFENLYMSLTEYKPDVIFIVGDIRHNKTNISPQYVELSMQLLLRLSHIAPVHILIGNHDCNMSNLQRMDAITPIVQAIHGHSDNPILYYKNSGLYRLNQDFQILACSMLDFDRFNLDDYPLGKRTRISLFHGTTKDAHNKYGYKFKQANDFVQLLQRYSDYGFFGDIHTAQILQNNKFRYCGSLIQQDFGEQINKGYMLWDIENKNKFDVKFVQIKNNIRFVTVIVKEQVMPEIQELTPQFNVRFIFKHKIKSQFIKSVIRKYKPLCSKLTYIKQDDVNPSTIKFQQGQLIQIHDRKFLLNKYFEKKKRVVNIGQILRLDDTISSELKDDYYDKKHRVTWTLNHLKFDDIFNYGANNEFDFTIIKGLNGVFGANRSGKSSFLNAILVAIYGRCSKSDDIKNIITFGKEARNTQIIIDTNIGQFKIVRTFQYTEKSGRKNPVKKSTVSVYFKKQTDEQWVVQNKVDKIQTERYIQSRFGKYQTILLSAFARQSKIQNFISVKQRQRIDILIKYFGLDIFSKLYSIANQKKKQIKSIINSKQQTQQDDIKLTQNVKYLQQQLQILSDLKSQLKSNVFEQQIRIKSLYQKLYPQEYQSATLRQIQQQISGYVNNIRINKEKIQSLSRYVGKQQNIQKISQIDKKIKKLQTIKIKAQHDIHNISKNFQEYKDIQQHQNCKNCKLMVDFKNNCGQKNNIQKAVEASLTAIQQLSNQRQAAKEQNEKIKLLKTLHKEVESQQKVLQYSMSVMKYMKQNQQNIRNNRIIKSQISKQEADYKQNLKKLQQYQGDYRVNQIQKRKITQKIQIVNRNKIQLQKYKKRFQIVELYCQAVNYQGIPKHIINYLLPKFQDRINQIISQMDQFKIKFKLQKELQILIDDRYIETASGMQQLIFSFAFRMRLAKYQYADLFVMDQAFSHLDPQNQIKAGHICKTIPQYFTHVFLVQHTQTVKDFVDNIIQIKRQQGRSKIFV